MTRYTGGYEAKRMGFVFQVAKYSPVSHHQAGISLGLVGRCCVMTTHIVFGNLHLTV